MHSWLITTVQRLQLLIELLFGGVNLKYYVPVWFIYVRGETDKLFLELLSRVRFQQWAVQRLYGYRITTHKIYTMRISIFFTKCTIISVIPSRAIRLAFRVALTGHVETTNNILVGKLE